MFEYKTLEELQAMSVEEQKAYFEAKAQHEAELREKEIKDAIAKAKEEDTSKDEIERLEKELSQLKSVLEKQIASIKAIGEGVSLKLPETVEQNVHKFITENHDKIKELKRTGSGTIELKVVGTVTTANASNPAGIPEIAGQQMAPAGNVNLRRSYVDELVTSFSTDMAAYAYSDTVPKEGDAAYTAEGTLKPQVDFNIETRYAQPFKVAAWLKLTEESIQDIRGLQSIATNYLRQKHDVRRQKGILFGDGIAPNPEGATTIGRAFVAGAMALTVTTPNIMDVINAAITDIYTTHNYVDEEAYMPNLVLMNPIDFFVEFVSAKDNDGKPLFPMAQLFNQVIIGGVTIRPERDVAQGNILVCDMSKYWVSDYSGYTVRIGWINDDFIKNEFCIVGESRHHAFVKQLDRQAFIYDSIATIKTAITKV